MASYTPISKYNEVEKNDCYILDSITIPNIEMIEDEPYFLNGLVRLIKPKKLLEVGVAAGGSSVVILNAIKDIPDAVLYSVDYSHNYYKEPYRKTGFVVDEFFPQLKCQWQLLTGGDISAFIDDIGNEIDFVLLDTRHIHPWETLNFLCVLPFLKKDSWVVIHDISYFISNSSSLACKYLFNHVTSEIKLTPPIDKNTYIEKDSHLAIKDIHNHISIAPNIGAFQITDDTYKYIKDVFLSLELPWVEELNATDLSGILKIICNYYKDDLIDTFTNALKIQIIQKVKKIQQIENQKKLLSYNIKMSLKNFKRIIDRQPIIITPSKEDFLNEQLKKIEQLRNFADGRKKEKIIDICNELNDFIVKYKSEISHINT